MSCRPGNGALARVDVDTERPRPLRPSQQRRWAHSERLQRFSCGCSHGEHGSPRASPFHWFGPLPHLSDERVFVGLCRHRYRRFSFFSPTALPLVLVNRARLRSPRGRVPRSRRSSLCAGHLTAVAVAPIRGPCERRRMLCMHCMHGCLRRGPRPDRARHVSRRAAGHRAGTVRTDRRQPHAGSGSVAATGERRPGAGCAARCDGGRAGRGSNAMARQRPARLADR